jgi:hypothetical protein
MTGQLAAVAHPVAAKVAQIVAAQVKAQAVKTNTDTYGGEYLDSIRAEYYTQIYEACYEYLTGESSITRTRNLGRKSVVNNFPSSFYSGYADGGGEETEDDDESWLTSKINSELGFIDDLFASLRDKRAEGMTKADADAEAATRAEGFRATLDSVYSEGKLRGAGNRMLTWNLGETEEHCDTCEKLDGQRHKAKWWRDHGYKPREPGSTTLDCHGFRCDCSLTDDKGEEFAI